MIVITGVGRCGTSATAAFFKNMGYRIGAADFNPYRRGGYEDLHTVSINNIIYRLEEGGLLNEENKLKVESALLSVADRDIVKDPRFTWSPTILQLWYRIYPHMKLLICTRHFHDSVRSRKLVSKEHPGIRWRHKSMSAEQLRDDYFTFMLEVYHLKIPYSMLDYPNFLKEYDNFVEVCRHIGLEWDYDKGRKTWDETIDTSMIHEFTEAEP